MIGIEGVASELHCDLEQAEQALALLRSLDPRPGAQIGDLPANTYVTPDCVISRQQGMWRVALANERLPRLTIHDRKSVVEGTGVSVRVELGGCRFIKKKKH